MATICWWNVNILSIFHILFNMKTFQTLETCFNTWPTSVRYYLHVDSRMQQVQVFADKIRDIRDISKLFNNTHVWFEYFRETVVCLQRMGAELWLTNSLLELLIPLLKHQELGCHQQRVPGVNQSVTIQLPSAEDVGGFLWNIQIKKC